VAGGRFPGRNACHHAGRDLPETHHHDVRNLLAMETEELLRSYPADGCVLLGGCDKTTPALLMGAISMNLPAIFVPAGPMLRGNWHGQILGSGSDVWKYWAERRAGNIDQQAWIEIEDGIARSAGTCMTMGTASTMTSVAEVLGFSLPGASSIPAVDSNTRRWPISPADVLLTWCGRISSRGISSPMRLSTMRLRRFWRSAVRRMQ